MMKWHGWVMCALCLVLVFSFSSGLFAAKQKAGFSLGIGAGKLFAADFKEYIDDWAVNFDTSDFNSELQAVFNFASIRIGISMGMIFSQYHVFYENSGIDYTDKNRRFTTMADFCLLPLRFFAPNLPFQLYLGGTIGLTGFRSGGLFDSDPFEMLGFGPKFGLECYLGNSVVLCGEGNYIYIPDDDRRSYFNALIGIRYRFPFE